MLRELAGETESVEQLTLEQRVQVFAKVPQGARANFWAAISWGLWGMTHGYIASARKNVAVKIRDYAKVVILLDEKFADGGGYRLLGRLHTLTPKIPFFTGWIDYDRGTQLLQKAYDISRKDPRNALFLGEALLEYGAPQREYAISLLREAAEFSPSEQYLVEQTHTITQARQRLHSLGVE